MSRQNLRCLVRSSGVASDGAPVVEPQPPGALPTLLHLTLARAAGPAVWQRAQSDVFNGRVPRRRATRVPVTTWAASSTGTCSHMRRTCHPARSSRAVELSSRATLRANLGRQYASFELGITWCSGHTCQKQPSTKTAKRTDVKAMSTRMDRPSSARTGRSFRNRSPNR